MGKLIRRRSIVLLLTCDDGTADEIMSAAIGFLKTNYNINQHQIETNKRTIFVKNYVDVNKYEDKKL